MAYTKEYKYLGSDVNKSGSVTQLIMDKTMKADRKFKMFRKRDVLGVGSLSSLRLKYIMRSFCLDYYSARKRWYHSAVIS